MFLHKFSFKLVLLFFISNSLCPTNGIENNETTEIFPQNKTLTSIKAILDLGAYYNIHHLVVTSVRNNDHRLADYEVSVTKSPIECFSKLLHHLPACQSFNLHLTASNSINLPCEEIGRYVFIKYPLNSGIGPALQLSDVQVYGTYSENQPTTSDLHCIEGNIALNKPVYASSVKANSWSQCSLTREQGKHWIIFDLLQTYRIQRVEYYWSKHLAYAEHDEEIIAFDGPWSQCSDYQLDNLEKCGTPITGYYNYSSFASVFCQGNGITGRYVGVRRRNYSTTQLSMCQFEVYGFATNGRQYTDLPQHYKQCNIHANENNIAYKKEILSPVGNNEFLTDGIEEKLLISFSNSNPIVIDLGRRFQIQWVRIWIFLYQSSFLANYHAETSDSYYSCLKNPLPSASTCAVVQNISNTNMIEFQCQAVGRYFVLRPNSNEIKQIKMKEIEIFGSYQEYFSRINDDYNPCVLSQDNIAFGKSVESLTENALTLTDGNTEQFLKSSNSFDWFVIDLHNYYNISIIRLWPEQTNEESTYTPIDIGFSNSFDYCKDKSNNKDIAVCQENVNIAGRHSIAAYNCSHLNNNRGYRYVYIKTSTKALQKHQDFYRGKLSTTFQDKKTGKISLAEIEVLGKLVSEHVFEEKPTFNYRMTDSEWKTKWNEMRLLQTRFSLFAGVNEIAIPQYTTQMICTGLNTEPLLIYNKRVVATAAVHPENFNSRVIFLGHHDIMHSLLEDAEFYQFRENLHNWLLNGQYSSNENIVVQWTNDIVVDNIPSKSIVYWDAGKYQHDHISVSKLLTRLRNEEILLVMALHGSYVQDNLFNQTTSYQITQAFTCAYKIINPIPRKVVLSYEALTREIDANYLPFEFLLQFANQSTRLRSAASYNIFHNLYGQNKNNRALSQNTIKTGKELIAQLEAIAQHTYPCRYRPVQTKNKWLMWLYNQLLLIPEFVEYGQKAVGVATYPGDFYDDDPDVNSGNFSKLTYRIKINTTFAEHISTGLYARPGAILNIIVNYPNNLSETEKWFISTGCDADILITEKSSIRYSRTFIKLPIYDGYIHTPFGGPIWLYAQRTLLSKTLDITLVSQKVGDILEHPYLDVRQGWASIERYNSKLRYSPVPWLELVGDSIALCIPYDREQIWQKSGEELYNITSEIWDVTTRSQFFFVGEYWTTKKRERITVDIQLLNGVVHSGYPIMATHTIVASLVSQNLFENGGNWLISRNLGHNRKKSAWTLDNEGEVTNSLIALFNKEKVFQNEITENVAPRSAKQDVVSYLSNSNLTYVANLRKSVVMLAMHYQLVRCFGYRMYHDLFVYYKQNNLNPSNNQEKLDTRLIVMSNLTNYNMLPFFDLWKLEYSNDTRDTIDNMNLQCHLLNDEFTEAVPDVVNNILENYDNNCIRSCNPLPDFSSFEWTGENRAIDMTWID